MNQLRGRYVNVVLTIEEGRGMGFIKNSLYVSANFNGRILESDMVEPSDNPSFNTELVWEIEKKDLRKIRSTNQPLRIECLSLNDENKKERVGFALLSLRSAKIVGCQDNSPLLWQKFIGVHDKKCCQPELSISLTIQEHLIQKPDLRSNESVMVMPYISEEESGSSSEVPSSRSSENFNTPVKYLEDGFIKVGLYGTDKFSLNIMIRSSANLDLLLPEILVFGKTKQKYLMSFKILGIVIKTKPFERALSDVIEMNEKIVVRLLSNKASLMDFLKSQRVLISFCCGNEKLGVTTVDLDKLMLSDDVEEVLECEELCYFKFPSPNGIVPCNGDAKPYIEVHSSLVMENNSSSKSSENNSKIKEQEKKISTIEKEKGYGDQICAPSPKKKAKMEANEANKKLENSPDVQLYILESPLPISPSLVNYKKFILEIALKNLEVPLELRRNYGLKIWHPKASSYLCNHKLSNEEYNKCRIFYVTTEYNLEKLLRAWRPKIYLMDVEEKNLSKKHRINTELFFKEKETDLFEEENLVLCRYKGQFSAKNKEDIPVKFEVVMTLTKEDLKTEYEKHLLDLLPPVIDEEISIKELMDLETWRKVEKDAFAERLKGLEKEEMEKYRKGLEEKKRKADEAMKLQMEQCKELQRVLQEKCDNLKTHKLIKKKRDALPLSVLNSIKEKVSSKYSKYDPELLLMVINKLEIDNQSLRDVVMQQNEQLRNHQKSALTREQTANLLQELRGLEEKFEEAKMAKGFFKAQWKKAFEEVHDLKTKDYKHLQAELKQSREELSNLSLDSYEEEHRDDNSIYDSFKSCKVDDLSHGDF